MGDAQPRKRQRKAVPEAAAPAPAPSAGLARPVDQSSCNAYQGSSYTPYVPPQASSHTYTPSPTAAPIAAPRPISVAVSSTPIHVGSPGNTRPSPLPPAASHTCTQPPAPASFALISLGDANPRWSRHIGVSPPPSSTCSQHHPASPRSNSPVEHTARSMWQEEDSLFSAPSSPQAQLVTRVATDQAQQDLRDTRLRFAEEELERLRREAEQNRDRAERAEALLREVAAGTPAQSSLHPSLVQALAEDGMFAAQLSAPIIAPVKRLRGSELVGKLSIVTAITPSTPSFVAQHADVLHGRNARKSFQFHEPSQYLHALAVAHRHGVYSEQSSAPKRARVGDRGSASSSSAAAAAPSGVYEVGSS